MITTPWCFQTGLNTLKDAMMKPGKTQRNSGKQTSLTILVSKPKSANNSDRSDPIINLGDDTCVQSNDMCYQYEHSMQHKLKHFLFCN